VESKAEIIDTENPELLIEEKNLLVDIYKSLTSDDREKAKQRYETRKKELLQERDKYIASRINSTLKRGETGILFIGAEHNVIPSLEKDIEVIDLVRKE
jgi:pheromone shutdown protein TraB